MSLLEAPHALQETVSPILATVNFFSARERTASLVAFFAGDGTTWRLLLLELRAFFNAGAANADGCSSRLRAVVFGGALLLLDAFDCLGVAPALLQSPLLFTIAVAAAKQHAATQCWIGWRHATPRTCHRATKTTAPNLNPPFRDHKKNLS